MSDRKPLMPKATAVWLVDNTALTFEQIAAFCGLHVLEVKGIADGDVAQGIKGMDPISSGQLSRDEIKRAEANSSVQLKIAEPKVSVPQVTTRKRGPRYTPVSRRQDRPNAVLWILRNHPELKDAQIIRLVGTTKPTIAQIRDRTHWNSASLQPQDPVTLGLCSQIDLDAEVRKGAARLEKERAANAPPLEEGGSLLPTAETTSAIGSSHLISEADMAASAPQETEAEEAARMFAKLQQLTGSGDAEPEEGQPDIEATFAKRPEAAKAEPEEAEAATEEASATGDDASSADAEADADADAAQSDDPAADTTKDA